MGEDARGPRLEAAEGLALTLGSRAWRVAWGEGDWLGPVGFAVGHGAERESGPDARGARQALRAAPRAFEGEDELGRFHGLELAWDPEPLPVRTSVRAYVERPVLVFRLAARRDLTGLATGRLDAPRIAWPWLEPARRRPDATPPGLHAFAHLYSEFAFPTRAGPALTDFFLLPHRPRAVAPLWLLAGDGRCLMLAPLDAFHEQVIAVAASGDAEHGVRCGWHGDLDAVDAGFATELALWAGPGPRVALEAWADFLRRRHRTERPSRYADAGVGRLSYWTDNGAAYWYRTEPGRSLPDTLADVAASLREQDVPVGAFELDSWFYPHQLTRPVGAAGQEHVPPTGLLAWEPRPDVLPDGIDGLRRRLGEPPLILHGRHFSRRSPYFEEHEAWVDGDRAHPVDGGLFDRMLAQAAAWGAIAYEQDWLVESFLGVRGLRERPGRARAWQEALDRAAAEHGLSLIWCMATPADFFQTLTLRRVVSIRTSGDYRYLSGNAANWVCFLYTNALARALGLHPFKDVFLSRRDGSGWDGDPHAEAEALLAALSAGPVGIGDRLGRSDRGLVLRTCRPDGLLVKPDVPLAALERCFQRNPYFEAEPLLGETHSRHPAGCWIYLAALNAWHEAKPLEARVALAELGAQRPATAVLAYDWRAGSFERLEPDAALDLHLAPGAWALHVLCPILAGEIALCGDATRYATAGDRRVRGVRCRERGVEFDVLGCPGEVVQLRGWSGRGVAEAETWTPQGRAALPRGADETPGLVGADGGSWRLRVRLGARGWVRVRLVGA